MSTLKASESIRVKPDPITGTVASAANSFSQVGHKMRF